MDINSFSTLIGIATTLTGAFVAVEYTKQYTLLLAERVFNLTNYLKEVVSRCKSYIDVSTIDNLGELVINGCNLSYKIEGLKRDKEKILNLITNSEENEKQYLQKRSTSRCYSALSFFIFMFSLSSLFVAGFESGKCEYLNSIRNFWILITFFSSLYILSAWFLGERKKFKYWIDYSSIMISFYVFNVILLICFGFLILLPEQLFQFLFNYYYIIIFITITIPFMNFIVYAFKIREISKEIKLHIDDTFRPIEEDCKSIKQTIISVSAACDLLRDVKIKENNKAEHKNNNNRRRRNYKRNKQKINKQELEKDSKNRVEGNDEPPKDSSLIMNIGEPK